MAELERGRQVYEKWLEVEANRDPNPVIAVQTRNGVVENLHRGIVCCVDCTGHVAYSAGNIDRLVYLRSGLKFIQVLPLLESGAAEHFNFSDKEISVMCASHDSEPFHLETVRGILDKIGCREDELGCGGHAPYLQSCAFQYVKEGHAVPFKAQIYNNCSGKHSGFLALAKYLNLSTVDYLSPEHPIQVLVQEAACDVFGISKEELHIGLDGCSAPTFAVTARQAAVGFSKLSSPDLHFKDNIKRIDAIKRMTQSITKHPEMVWGSEGFDSILMRRFNGKVIGKRGAAGVYTMGLVGRGLSCVVKVDDGTEGPQYNVAMKFLNWAAQTKDEGKGLYADLAGSSEDDERLREFSTSAVKDYNDRSIGALFVPPQLFA